MKKRILAAFSAAMVSVCASAQEPARGWYVGAEIGQADFGGESDTAFKFLGGYRITRHFAAEGAYAWLFDKNGAEATAFELVAVGSLPLANQFSVFGKLGFANAYIESSTLDEEKVELTYGVGVQYDLNHNLGLRAQWQRYDTSEEIDFLSLGLVWRF
jgi:OOP family OmpA-OmpF porin